jgi:hypothetical protein
LGEDRLKLFQIVSGRRGRIFCVTKVAILLTNSSSFEMLNDLTDPAPD